MRKIGDSSKQKHLDNGVEKQKGEEDSRRCELTICATEDVSPSKGLYILGLCGTTSEPDPRIAVAFSDYSCSVYSVGEGLSKTITLPCNDSPVVGIKFSPHSKHILYTATRDGIITACDLRAKGKVISTLRDSGSDGKLRPFASFDVSSDDRLIVAGSEHVGGDAFILFWDLRYNSGKTEGKSDFLGGYWESHMDDVTTLAFHPTKVDALASGSTDGLINVFDLTRSSEDSALEHSLNTESSVDRLNWLDNGNLWCTTHTHELQLWECEGAEPYGKFDRTAVGSVMSSDPDNCYVVKMHNANSFGQPFLVAGSTSANMRLSGLSFKNGELETCYDLIGNKQLVRDSWYHEKSERLITGGEMGIINVWKQSDTDRYDAAAAAAPATTAVTGTNAAATTADKLGKKARDKQPRAKPY